MDTQKKCLNELAELRSSYSDPESAYVARTRLQRILMSALQHVVELSGLEGPEVPGPFRISQASSREARELARSCNRIFELSRTLCQPSEALDSRWESGWTDVDLELQKLERLMMKTG